MSDILQEKIRNRLKEIRILKKMSQKELATKIGYDQQTISKIENGGLPIGFVTLQRYCDGLDCSFDVIITPNG